MKDLFLIDVDDTLLDFKRGERIVLSRVLQEGGLRADDAVLTRFHHINDGLWKRLERGELTRARLATLRFELLFAEFGMAADAEEIAARYFENMGSATYLLAGAEEFLQALTGLGKIYYVTNGAGRVQRPRLAGSGLMRYASGVFISEEVGFAKPAAEYARAVEAGIADFCRARAVWVGDSLTSDRACAQGAQIDFILFSPSGAPAGYEGACARTHEEALALIRAL